MPRFYCPLGDKNYNLKSDLCFVNLTIDNIDL